VGGEEKYYKKTLPNAIHDFVADGYGCYHATEDGKDIYYVHAQ
jgi:hypothetical protein